MSKRLVCPHCHDGKLIRDFYKAYYVEINTNGWYIDYSESDYEPNIEDSVTRMYCEQCWDFIELHEIEDQIEEIKKALELKKLKKVVKDLRKEIKNEKI